MMLLSFMSRFTAGVVILIWVHVWRWCYPQSSIVIDEIARGEIDLLRHRSSVRRLIGMCIALPGLARPQQVAKTSPATRTAGMAPATEPRWKGSLREALVWAVLAGWAVMAVPIITSIAQTGDFLFEYGPDSGRPEIVTPYFKAVALAALAQIVSVVTGLTFLRLVK